MDDADAAMDATETSAAAADWSLSLTDCVEGGFVAVYDGTFGGPSVQEPWVLADIGHEMGDPILSSLVVPLTDDPTGHWHMAIHCAEATFDGDPIDDFQAGWVGAAVEPPAWDHGGADFHVLLAGFGLEDGAPRDALVAQTTAAVSTSLRAQVDWLVPENAIYAVYDDDPKGVYEVWGPVQELRELDDRTMRFWWTVPTDGSDAHHHFPGEAHDEMRSAQSGFHPVYWDVQVAGGGVQYVADESYDPGCHSGTDHHGPQGGACQPIMGNVYERPSMHFEYGGVVEDVVIQNEWVH